MTRTQFERGALTRLGALGRRLRWYLLLDGLAVVSLAVLATVLVTLAVDHGLRLDWDMRLAQLVTLLIVLAAISWRVVFQRLRLPISNEHLAVLVERRYPHLQSRLITAVEFTDPARTHRAGAVKGSPAMIDAVVGQAQEESASLSFYSTLDHRRARRRAAGIAACAIILGLLALSAPRTMGLWFQRNVLLQNADWPRKNRLTVEGLSGGKMVVPRGDDVVISAVVDEGFDSPRQVYIQYESGGGVKGREQMPAVTARAVRFTHTFERIEETLRCRIIGGDADTGWFTIEVVDRPRISGVLIGIAPPAYTNIERYDLRRGQTVAEALAGSEIHLRIETNKSVSAAGLIRQIEGEQTLIDRVKGVNDRRRAFTVTDLPPATATYYFRLVDELGLSNAAERAPPVRISVRLAADQPPKVKMKIRGVGEMVTPEAILPIETDFSDTYGLASARLAHRSSRPGGELITEPMPGFEAASKAFARTLDWPVGSHGLGGGDRLSLHAEAEDFNDVSGPGLGRSATRVFRVVSREELLAELNRREQEYRQDFERVLRLQEELYADLLTLSRPPDPKVDPGQRGQRFAQLARRQRDQAGRSATLGMQFDQVLSELRINQLSSPGVEDRLGRGVVEPLEALARTGMPRAAAELDNLAGEDTPPRIQAARDAQGPVLAEMNRILANMLQWEGFQEVVILLREVLKMQRKVNQETETGIEAEVFGTEPGSRPSNQ